MPQDAQVVHDERIVHNDLGMALEKEREQQPSYVPSYHNLLIQFVDADTLRSPTVALTTRPPSSISSARRTGLSEY